MPGSLDLTAIIVNHKSAAFTVGCINSIKQQLPSAVNFLVVDNSPNDESPALNQNDPSVTILRLEQNQGFAQAVNFAVEHLPEHKPRFLLLLNPDTYCNQDFISPLLNLLEQNSNLAAVCPLILDTNSSVWYAGGHLSILKGGPIHSKTVNLLGGQKYIETDFVTGCALLLRTQTFQKLGGLPEEYFLYFEDAEFSIRLKRNGANLACLPTAQIYHHISTSTDPKSLSYIWLYGRNRIWFMKRNFSKYPFMAFLMAHYLLRLPSAFIYFILKERNPFKFIAFLKGTLIGTLTAPIEKEANRPPFLV